MSGENTGPSQMRDEDSPRGTEAFWRFNPFLFFGVLLLPAIIALLSPDFFFEHSLFLPAIGGVITGFHLTFALGVTPSKIGQTIIGILMIGLCTATSVALCLTGCIFSDI